MRLRDRGAKLSRNGGGGRFCIRDGISFGLAEIGNDFDDVVAVIGEGQYFPCWIEYLPFLLTFVDGIDIGRDGVIGKSAGSDYGRFFDLFDGAFEEEREGASGEISWGDWDSVDRWGIGKSDFGIV